MAKNWGRTPVTNADKRSATQTKYLVTVGDVTEERIDRRPLGKVERFVDPDGGVMSLQLYADGDPYRAATEIRVRNDLHKKGFVEFAKCPVKHGTRNASPKTSRDFAKMPGSMAGECARDPKVMERRDGELHAGKSCQHIEWLIEYRRAEAAKAYAQRNGPVVAKEQAEAKRRELDALEIEEKIAARESRKAPRVSRSKDAAE